MKKGSVTIFLALVLVLVMSFVFSLLEGARVYCLQSRAKIVTELCMQSMFGNYHAGLWKDYHLLFLDGTWQEGDFSMERFRQKAMEELEENLSVSHGYVGIKSWDLTRLRAENINIDSYELATDCHGKVFQSQVRLQMQREIAENALEELLGLKEQGKSAENRREQKEGQWEQAWDAMEQAEEIQQEKEADGRAEEIQQEKKADGQAEDSETVSDTESGTVSGTDSETDLENPMDYVKQIRSSSVLALVLKDPSGLSGKALEDTDYIEKRQLQEGNRTQEVEAAGLDRLYLQYYIRNYFSNYAGESENGPKERVLSYEMEYLLGGKQRDSENLEIVVYELLGIREALNFVTIMQDAEKKSLALSIATTAVGFTGLAPLVKAVQIGVLLAWAFVESVLDVRALLDGKKIPFLKRTDQWSSDLDCRNSIEGDSESRESGEGLSYAQYLQMLLFLLSEKTINYRCMDLIERNQQIKMDSMIQSVEGTFEYGAEPLFWNLNTLVQKGWKSFSIPAAAFFSYGAK